MKILIVMVLVLMSSGIVAKPLPLALSGQIYDNQQLPFIAHHGTGRFGRYLTMTIAYPPMKALFEQFSSQYQQTLKSRGEAHITVVTPVEYDQLLRAKLNIKQLDEIALKANIQHARFKVVCLGRGQANVNGIIESTYYVVLNSDDLVDIRRQIQQLYIKNGGLAKDFEPTHFYPHITLGFSHRDLHQSDGVRKDKTSCFSDLKVVD